MTYAFLMKFESLTQPRFPWSFILFRDWLKHFLVYYVSNKCLPKLGLGEAYLVVRWKVWVTKATKKFAKRVSLGIDNKFQKLKLRNCLESHRGPKWPKIQAKTCAGVRSASGYGEDEAWVCSWIFGHDDPKQGLCWLFCGEIVDRF